MSPADQDEPSRPRRRRGAKRGADDGGFDDFWTRESQQPRGRRRRGGDAPDDPADVADLTGPAPAGRRRDRARRPPATPPDAPDPRGGRRGGPAPVDPLPHRSPGRDAEPYRPEPARDPLPRRGVAAPVDPLPARSREPLPRRGAAAPVDPLPARSREPLPRRGAAAPVDPLPPRAPAGAVDPRSRRPLRGAAAEAARRGRPPAGTGYDTGYPPAGREPATGSGWPAARGGAEAAPAWDDDPWPTTGGVAAAGGVYGRSADPRSGPAPAPVGYDAPPWASSGSGTLADESAAWAGGPGPRPLAGDDDYGDDTYYDEDDDGGADDLHRRRGCRAVLMVLAVLVVVAAVGGWFGWSWVQRQIDPPGRPGKEVLVEIPDGTSTAGIGKVLADADVISDARVWSWYTKLRDVGSFQAGTYKLREHSSFAEAIDDLAADPLPPNSRLVQVPPGFTVDETVARLADPAKGVPGFTADAVRAAMADPASRSAYLPADQPSLEGTLYPETYAVAEGDTPAVVIQRIVGQFDQVMNQLDANGRAPALNMTPYQAVIVASLVEQEARVPEDRPKIARVIYNRLAANQPLGIDAALCYVKAESPCALTDADIAADGPYNTRLRPGLPPTPITSPSQASLEAALAPADGDWLYYVLADADGRHAFTNSYDEFVRLKDECKAKGLGCG